MNAAFRVSQLMWQVGEIAALISLLTCGCSPAGGEGGVTSLVEMMALLTPSVLFQAQILAMLMVCLSCRDGCPGP